MDLMHHNHVVAGFYLPRIMTRPDLFAPSLQEVLGWISSGELSLTIGACYPLEQAPEAHDALEGRQTTGKIVLNP
jgi:NADPH:quinone reductase